MNRRDFCMLASAAACDSLCWRAGAQDPRIMPTGTPFLEDQHPTSARGRELAAIARSIHIEREIEFVRRPERTLKLSVYRPAQDSGARRPVILCFGLAAWLTDTSDFRLDLSKLIPAPTPNLYPPVLVPQGYIIVAAQLRSSLEAQFPAQIQDCQAAFSWLLREGPSRGFDLNRIGLMGASASGHLVSLLALMNGEEHLVDPASPLQWPLPVKAVCSMSGFYDFEYYRQDPGDGTLWPQIRQFLGTYEEHPQRYLEASPQSHIRHESPAFFLDHGVQDRRVPYSQAVRFHAALQQAKVSVDFVPINHYHHGPDPGDVPDPPYRVTDQRIYRFFEQRLKRA
jgi:acetyl esterase/lipase